jgi:hypothetical protein
MKHNFSLLMACSLVAVLSACGGGSDSPETPPVSSSAPAVSSSSLKSSSSAVSSSIVSSVSSSINSSSISSSELSSSSVSSSAQSVASSSSLSSVQSSAQNSSIAQLSTLISGNVYLKDSSGDSVDLDAPNTVSLTLSLLNSEGNVVAASSPQLINSITSSTDAGAPFTTELSGADAKTIVVIVSKPGFSDYARRLEFAPNINLTATL